MGLPLSPWTSYFSFVTRDVIFCLKEPIIGKINITGLMFRGKEANVILVGGSLD